MTVHSRQSQMRVAGISKTFMKDVDCRSLIGGNFDGEIDRLNERDRMVRHGLSSELTQGNGYTL